MRAQLTFRHIHRELPGAQNRSLPLVDYGVEARGELF